MSGLRKKGFLQTTRTGRAALFAIAHNELSDSSQGAIRQVQGELSDSSQGATLSEVPVKPPTPPTPPPERGAPPKLVFSWGREQIEVQTRNAGWQTGPSLETDLPVAVQAKGLHHHL